MAGKEKRFDKLIASVLIVLLAAFLLWALSPFLKGIFGALVLFVIFRPLFVWFKDKKRIRQEIAAFIVILISLAIVTIPLAIAGSLMVGEINNLLADQERADNLIQSIDGFLDKTKIDLSVSGLVREVGNYLRKSLLKIAGSIAAIIVNLVIMYFVLFYLLIDYDYLKKNAHTWIPFSKKNSEKLIHEFKEVTQATLFSTGTVALLQAILLTIGFLIFKIPGAFLWGFVGFILAFLPLVGVPLIWLPAGLILLTQGNYFSGVGILIWGTLLSTLDDLLRPWLGERFSYGEIHPLTILIGIFIGIPFFGILGIVVGPLLLAYFFMIWKMFNEEYIK